MKMLPFQDEIDFLCPHLSAGQKVLDLGCGDGKLLQAMRQACNIKGYGLEIEDESIQACIEQGINVIQHDLNQTMPWLQDNQFELAILSNFLQYSQDPIAVLHEAARVARFVAVFFEDNGSFIQRLKFLFEGKMQDHNQIWTRGFNRRFFSVKDFHLLCLQEDFGLIAQDVSASKGLKAKNAMFMFHKKEKNL